MLDKHKKNNKKCNCNRQFERIRKQLDRIEKAIESSFGQSPPPNRICHCSSTFRAISGGTFQISGEICIACDPSRSFISFSDGKNTFRLDSLESTSCFNTGHFLLMAVTGFGIFKKKRVHFVLFLFQSLLLQSSKIVFFRPSIGPNFIFIDDEVIELSLTDCDE